VRLLASGRGARLSAPAPSGAFPGRATSCVARGARLRIARHDAHAHAHACLPALCVIAVPRHDHHHAVPAPRQRLRQRAHHIAQAACAQRPDPSWLLWHRYRRSCSRHTKHIAAIPDSINNKMGLPGMHGVPGTSPLRADLNAGAQSKGTTVQDMKQAGQPHATVPIKSRHAPVFDQGAHSAPTMTTFITFGPASGSCCCGVGGGSGSYAGSCCCGGGGGGKLSSAGGGGRTGCGIHVCALLLLLLLPLLGGASGAWPPHSHRSARRAASNELVSHRGSSRAQPLSASPTWLPSATPWRLSLSMSS
jgi:hypothetical protein